MKKKDSGEGSTCGRGGAETEIVAKIFATEGENSSIWA